MRSQAFVQIFHARQRAVLFEFKRRFLPFRTMKRNAYSVIITSPVGLHVNHCNDITTKNARIYQLYELQLDSFYQQQYCH